MPETLVAGPTIEVTPFRAEDARALKLTDRSVASLQGVDLDEAWRQYETKGVGWTLRVDGVVVGCAGLLTMWPGVMHAWLLPSIALGQYPKTVVVAIVERFRALIDERGLRRVELTVQGDFLLGHRFVQWLGFSREADGIARRYGPADEDLVRYELVRPR